jgi:hypothetical protein
MLYGDRDGLFGHRAMSSLERSPTSSHGLRRGNIQSSIRLGLTVMLHFPVHPQRAWLRSFWLALGMVECACVMVFCWLYGTRYLFGIAVVAMALLLGLLWPHLLIWPYRAWNKIARFYLGIVESFVLNICFFTVIVPAGWAGSHLNIDRPGVEQSLWLTRQFESTDISGKPCDSSGSGMEKKYWISRYVSWAYHSRQSWALALLPFLLLLSWLGESEPAQPVPENIYTLY